MDQFNISALKSKTSVNHLDFVQFVKALAASSKHFSDQEFFLSFSPVVKEWISSFTVIFAKYKVDNDLKIFISKFCVTITYMYSKMSQCFHRYEPSYIQEFYCHWEELLCLTKPSYRTKSCIKCIDRMKIAVGHMRSAKHRLEQMVILDVLCLYTETVSLDKLNALNENGEHDMNILIEISKMGKKPTPKQRQFLLSSININNDNILTVRPMAATPVEILLNSFKGKIEVYLDFNIKDKSVSFVALSSTGGEFICLGIVAFPKIQEYALPDPEKYQLVIQGCWNMLSKIPSENMCKDFTIIFFCQNQVKALVSQLSAIFDISLYRDYDIVAVQEKNQESESIAGKTNTVLFNEFSSDDDGNTQLTTPSRVARLSNRSSDAFSASECYGSEEKGQPTWAWFLKENASHNQSEVMNDRHPRKADTEFYYDSLRVNIDSNGQNNARSRKPIGNDEDRVTSMNNVTSSRKRTYDKSSTNSLASDDRPITATKMTSTNNKKSKLCAPQRMNADANAVSPEQKYYQKATDQSAPQSYQGPITTRRRSKFVIVEKNVNKANTKTSKKVYMSIDCETRNIQINKPNDDSREGDDKNNRQSTENVLEEIISNPPMNQADPHNLTAANQFAMPTFIPLINTAPVLSADALTADRIKELDQYFRGILEWIIKFSDFIENLKPYILRLLELLNYNQNQ